MPLLSIETNQTSDIHHETSLPLRASALIAQWLGKPERYVMVTLRHNPAMCFGGSTQALAYLELKSIGLPEQRTTELSEQLCKLVSEQLDIPQERIYIEFSNAQAHLWGWNSATF